MSRKLIIIITMMFLGLSWLTSPALANNDVVQLASANATTPKVVFRLDDTQDWFCRDAQQDIIKVFADYSVGGTSSPQGISIGIIGDYFGSDGNLVKEIQQQMIKLGDHGEVVSHSMTHDRDFSTKPYEEQVKELEDFRKKMNGEDFFPEKEIRTFIPPENKYSHDTIAALEEAGYEILSGQCTSSNCKDPGDVSSTPAYLPAGASTGGWGPTLSIQPAEKIFGEIQAQIDIEDWSVVMMHPQEFSTNAATDCDIVNQDALDTLRRVIGMCRENGYELVTYMQLVDSVQ